MSTRYKTSILLPLLLSPLHSHAAIALQQTRVIFDGDKTSASLLVNNQNPTAPYLAQGWIEDAQGKKIQGPLLLLPPIQRIEAGAASQIKIQSLPAANLLRQDRETLFYLNLREIPPRNDKPNTLNIALQNRIKVFYRPAALKAPPGELATPWQSRLVMEKQGERWRITNPSAYYITLVEARRAENTPGTGKAGSSQAATREKPATGGKQGGLKAMEVAAFTPLMLAPGDSAVLPGSAADYGRTPVFTYLNDYGGRPKITFQCDTQRCRVTANRVPLQ